MTESTELSNECRTARGSVPSQCQAGLPPGCATCRPAVEFRMSGMEAPQKKLVHENSSTIAELYSRFDNGLCSVDAFLCHCYLWAQETPALARLLRTTPASVQGLDGRSED